MITNSAQQTQKIGNDFAQTLKGGEVICLYGDLGFGKTTFTQGLASGLGIQKRITSPTFTIIRQYNYSSSEQSESRSSNDVSSRQARTIKSLYHIDLYRIESEKDVEGLGLKEILEDKDSVVVIEWPEKLRVLLPEKRIDVRFEYIDGTKRTITIT